MSGAALAGALADVGAASYGMFWSGHLFRCAVSYKLRNQVMMDIDMKCDTRVNAVTRRIRNQAICDVAQALGTEDVKSASFH